MRKMRLLLMVFFFPSVLFSQTGAISGKVTDRQTNEALSGATVAIEGSLNAAVTNNDGNFSFQKVNVGTVVLRITYVGYETLQLSVKVNENITAVINPVLEINDQIGNAVVVISASRHAEKITDAPASIHVIGVKDFDQFPGSDISELVSRVQGVEYTRSGIDGITFNARGFHSAFNNKVLDLVDGRNSMAALSGGLPLFNNGSYVKDDIERLEIVLGPQTALYGPNAHNAVFNTITKDHRKYPGTTVSVSGGNHYQFSARVRQASKISDKWAYKLVGEYASGKEFVFHDSVYLDNFAPPSSIPEHNVKFDFRHIRGEAHLYYTVAPKTDIILSGGSTNNNYLPVTPDGRNQMQGVTYSFLQARLVHPNYFVNIYNTWGNIGNSYVIKPYTLLYWIATQSANPLPPDSAEAFALQNSRGKERSQRLNAEAQYNYTVQKAGLFLVAGLNYQKENPNGYGVNLVDRFERIHIAQYGAVFQVEKSLPWRSRFIGAVRYDHHSNFGDFYSPKIGLVKKVVDGSLRITWGRAYAMPNILSQYAGIQGVLFGNGEGVTYVPDGKYIPPGTNLRDAPKKVTTPLKPEEVSTWEVGYKGTFAKKLFVDISYYNGLSNNFLGPEQQVEGYALSVGHIPVQPGIPGAVVNDTLKDALFYTYFNYRKVRATGVDVGLAYSFNKNISLSVRYSWFGSDITKDDLKNDANNDGYVSLEETSLNAPKNRGLVMLNLQNLCKQKMFVDISTRFVQRYDFYSGNQIGTEAGKGNRGVVFGGPDKNGQPRYYYKNFDWGPLGGFATVDINAGCKLNEMVSIIVGITNLLNTKQIEFVGSPSIGRLIMFEIKVHVPNAN